MAERDALLFGNSTGQLGLPVTLEYLYDRHRVPAPEEGEQLFEPGGIMPPEPATWSDDGTQNGNGDGNGNVPRGTTPAIPGERQLAPGVQPKQAGPAPGALPGTGLPARQTGVPRQTTMGHAVHSPRAKMLRTVQIGARRTPSFHKELEALPDRGAAEQAAADDLEQYFKDNANSIKSIKWKSVVDDRTTDVCKMLNGRSWSYPGLKPRGGHAIPFPGFPPILYNCRSTALPVLKTFPAIKSWLQKLIGVLPHRTKKAPFRYKGGTLPKPPVEAKK
jgi:hypothetical protein